MNVYYCDWNSKKGLMSDFQISEEQLEGVEILFAAYTYEDYSGDAFVLFRKDEKLYEVNGGHCSCYGLEGQWEPEETTIEAIKVRLKSDYGFSGYRSELSDFLAYLQSTD